MELIALARAIAAGKAKAKDVTPYAHARFVVAATRADATDWFLEDIRHYVYAGDTLLHVAAAAHATALVRALLKAGADVAAANRRGAQPLHYACDGAPNLGHWDPAGHGETVTALVAAGADPNAVDKSGVAPIYRAIRKRSTGAVRALVEAGAIVDAKARRLVTTTTGASGSGSAAAKREQAAIALFLNTVR